MNSKNYLLFCIINPVLFIILLIWGYILNKFWVEGSMDLWTWVYILLSFLSFIFVFIIWIMCLIISTDLDSNQSKKNIKEINKKSKWFIILWTVLSTLWLVLTIYVFDLGNFCINACPEDDPHASINTIYFVFIISTLTLLRPLIISKLRSLIKFDLILLVPLFCLLWIFYNILAWVF